MTKFIKVCEFQSNTKFINGSIANITADIIIASDEGKLTYIWKKRENPIIV
jgi:hypothetical protein